MICFARDLCGRSRVTWTPSSVCDRHESHWEDEDFDFLINVDPFYLYGRGSPSFHGRRKGKGEEGISIFFGKGEGTRNDRGKENVFLYGRERGNGHSEGEDFDSGEGDNDQESEKGNVSSCSDQVTWMESAFVGSVREISVDFFCCSSGQVTSTVNACHEGSGQVTLMESACP